MAKKERIKQIEISFDEPVKIGGEEKTSLVMRRQKVQDALDAEILAGSASVASQEVALFSILCGVPMEDLKQWDSLDYQKLQEGYLFLVNEAKDRQPPAGIKPCASQAGQAGA